MFIVRLACVQYLNTVPLIEGLDKVATLRLLPAVPARIAATLAEGQADLGLVSLVDAVQSPVPLVLVPVGMIGCDGPTLTVRLFSRVPPARIACLHADQESHTSVVLAQVLLAAQYGRRPEVIPFDTRAFPAQFQPARAWSGREPPSPAHWPEALLLIGDKVVASAPPADLYPYQMDLGQTWKELTGLPFVYAVWMYRHAPAGGSAPERPNSTPDSSLSSEALGMVTALLDRQLRRNLTRLAWIVARHAPAHGWPIPLAEQYLGAMLRYRVGERERMAAQTFLNYAADLGLLPRRPLVWADPWNA